jgi:hypothetical protein
MKQLIIILTMLSGMSVLAQEAKFTATVSKETVALNSKFKLEFKLENAQGTNFQAPDFDDFIVVGGPSTSSSMSIINGEVTQSISYVYYLKPKETGSFTVKAAKIKAGNKDLKTEKLSIKVVEGGDAEMEDENTELRDPFNGFFQQRIPSPQPKQETPRKKRKAYQI